MDNETNAVADFLNNVAPPDVFKEETVAPEVVEDTEEKALPFHKDPKVQRYVDKQISKALEGRMPAEQRKEEVVASDVKDTVAAFTVLIGNDTPEKVEALSKLERALNGSDERASQKAIERIQKQASEQAEQRTAADNAALEELQTGFEEIEETLGVDLTSNTPQAQKLNTEFRQYLKKIAPKDGNGEVKSFPDIPAAFEEFQEKNKRAPATRAKELANRGMTRSNDTTAPVPQGRSWKDVDRYFDTLKS